MEYVFKNFRTRKIEEWQRILDDDTRWLYENEKWYTILVPPINGNVFIEREELISYIDMLEKEERMAAIDRFQKKREFIMAVEKDITNYHKEEPNCNISFGFDFKPYKLEKFDLERSKKRIKEKYK